MVKLGEVVGVKTLNKTERVGKKGRLNEERVSLSQGR